MYEIPDDILTFFFSQIVKRGKCRIERIDNQIYIKSRLEHEYYKPVICVNDLEKLEKSLITYINTLNDFIKKYNCVLEDYYDLSYILNHIFLNMVSSDSVDLASYVDKRTAFIKDKLFSEYDKKKEIFQYEDVSFFVQRVLESPGLETPFILIFSMNINGVDYELPLVRYAFDDNKVCHLFAVQTGRLRNVNYNDEVFKSVVNKVNRGVNAYRNVSPSFVLVLTLFFKMLSEHDIKNIVVPDYLFSRYRKYYRNNGTARSDMILKRILNNFITLLQRMEMQINGIEIKNYPNEIDSYTHLTIQKMDSKNKLLAKIFEN